MGRKILRALGALALVATLSLGGTAVDSEPAEGLQMFISHDLGCALSCPVDAGDGDCCAQVPPIIVDVPG